MKKRYKVAVTILVIIFLWIMISTDYYLAKVDRKPIFAFQTDIYKDGVSKEYTGFGYKVMNYNQIDGRNVVVFVPFYTNVE